MRVLLVDDHLLNQEVLGAVARGAFAGAHIDVADDLQRAIDRAGNGDAPDLVLLDLGLPGCAGLEALIAFRKAYPPGRGVVISAAEDSASVAGAMQAGAAGYVPKSYTPPRMAAALRLIAQGGTYLPTLPR